MTHNIRWIPFIRYFQQKGFDLIFDIMEERSVHLLFYREIIPSDKPQLFRFATFIVDDEKCKGCVTDKELLENHSTHLDEHRGLFYFGKFLNLNAFNKDENVMYSGHMWRFDPMVKLGLAFLKFLDAQKGENGEDK